MLNKKVCLACYKQHNFADSIEAHIKSLSVYGKNDCASRFEYYWNHAYCPCFLAEDGLEPRQSPPKECPYFLEHILEQQKVIYA